MITSRSFLLILLLTKCLNSDPRGLVDERSRQSRFLDVDLDFLDDAVGDVGRDFSQIYTGWVNSSFIYPYYLKVRSSLCIIRHSRPFKSDHPSALYSALAGDPLHLMFSFLYC